jgi:hypothetical protein
MPLQYIEWRMFVVVRSMSHLFSVYDLDKYQMELLGWFVVESDDEDGASEEVVVEESDSYE